MGFKQRGRKNNTKPPGKSTKRKSRIIVTEDDSLTSELSNDINIQPYFDRLDVQNPPVVLLQSERPYLCELFRAINDTKIQKAIEILMHYFLLLSVNTQLFAISLIVEQISGKWPKPLQRDAIYFLYCQYLSDNPCDLILTVRTSYGKSLVLQTLPLLRPHSIALIIVPLDRLGREQEAKINAFQSVRSRALFLHGNNIHQEGVLDDVKQGKYTHVLLSPELAIGSFHDTSIDPYFKDRVAAILIDEVHLVSQWGKDFRPKFAQIQVLRQRIGFKVPMFGCSATLDEESRRQVIKWAGFHRVHEIRGSIDRAAVKLIVCELPQGQKKKFSALFFTISDIRLEGSNNALRIPKTLIFIDSKQRLRNCVDTIRHWLQEWAGVSATQAKRIIMAYHANTAAADQDNIYREMKDPDSQTRIVVCTESLGLGVDLDEISRVVQYGIPTETNLQVLIQRFGRAARRPGLQGSGIFIVEGWAFGDRSNDHSHSLQPTIARLPSTRPTSNLVMSYVPENDDIYEGSDIASDIEEKRTQKQSSQITRRTELPYAFWQYINAGRNNQCRRRDVIWKHYNEEESRQDSREEPCARQDCCDVCDPGSFKLEPLPGKLHQARRLQKPKEGSRAGLILQYFKDWRAHILTEDFSSPNDQCPPPPEIFLDEYLLYPCCRASNISTVEALKASFPAEWRFWDNYGERLFMVFQRAGPAADERIRERRNRNPLPSTLAPVQQLSTLPTTVSPTASPVVSLAVSPSRTRRPSQALQPETPKRTRQVERIPLSNISPNIVNSLQVDSPRHDGRTRRANAGTHTSKAKEWQIEDSWR